MSASIKNASIRAQKPVHTRTWNPASAPRFKKVGPLKAHLDRKDDLKLAGATGLKPDSFKVFIVTSRSSIEYTIHHPIGFTDLKDDDWVATASSDIPVLLARAGHPGAKARASLVNEMFEQEGVSRGLLKKFNGRVLPVTGKSQTEMTKEIEDEQSTISEAMQRIYQTLVAQLKGLRKECEAAVPKLTPYFTGTGFDGGHKQVKTCLVGDQATAADQVVRLLADNGPLAAPISEPLAVFRQPVPVPLEPLVRRGDDVDELSKMLGVNIHGLNKSPGSAKPPFGVQQKLTNRKWSDDLSTPEGCREVLERCFERKLPSTPPNWDMVPEEKELNDAFDNFIEGSQFIRLLVYANQAVLIPSCGENYAEIEGALMAFVYQGLVESNNTIDDPYEHGTP